MEIFKYLGLVSKVLLLREVRQGVDSVSDDVWRLRSVQSVNFLDFGWDGWRIQEIDWKVPETQLQRTSSGNRGPNGKVSLRVKETCQEVHL